MRIVETTSRLNDLGYARYDLAAHLDMSISDGGLRALTVEFDDLPADPYATDAGRYRRFGRGVLLPWSAEFRWMPGIQDDVPDSPADPDGTNVYQQGMHNPEYAGTVRHMPGLTDGIRRNPLLAELIMFDFNQTAWPDTVLRWPMVVGVHLVKLSVSDVDGVAVSSPDTLHQDGEPYTFVHLVHRHNAEGGENVIATPHCTGRRPRDIAPEQKIAQFTLDRPLDSYGIRDALVSHYVAPITMGSGHGPAERAVLLIDFTPLAVSA